MTKGPLRVLVLGATGHVGQAVVRHYLDQGCEVTAATRRANPEALRGLRVKVVRIDGELGGLSETATAHDLLVDAAAPYPIGLHLPGSPPWRLQVENAVRHTQGVLEAARRNHLKLVFISTVATLPRHESPQAAASTLFRRSTTPYFEAKIAMERCVLAAARDGLPAVIVNPTSFIGPWEFRKFDDCFVNLVLSGRFPIVMSQMNSVIDVRDVAGAIDRAVSRELFGCPIPLAGHNVSLPDLVYRTAQAAGMRFPPPVPFDTETSTMIAFWGQTACNLLGIESPNPWKLIPLVADLVPMSPSPAQIALGVTIRPLEETLRDSVAFHRRRGRG